MLHLKIEITFLEFEFFRYKKNLEHSEKVNITHALNEMIQKFNIKKHYTKENVAHMNCK